VPTEPDVREKLQVLEQYIVNQKPYLQTRLSLAAVSVATNGGGSQKLYAHRWTLTEVDGQPVTPAGTDRDAHLLFTTLNRVTGSTGCNRLTGTYELLDGNKIRFSPLATTRMLCPDSDGGNPLHESAGYHRNV
jgi:heat shock protein HslJ